MDSSIIHDNICSLIHKKFHPKSYLSDIKDHVNLNILFSVVNSSSNDRAKKTRIMIGDTLI